jgi:glutamine synthetase
LRPLTKGDVDDIPFLAEYEFYNFREQPNSIAENKGVNLEHMTPGMFGYSLTRPVQNQDFYFGVFNACGFQFSVTLERL